MNHEPGGRPFFAPEVVAQVKALAGELPAQTGLPLPGSAAALNPGPAGRSLWHRGSNQRRHHLRSTGSTQMPSAPGNAAVGFPPRSAVRGFQPTRKGTAFRCGPALTPPEPGKWKFTRVALRELAVTLKRTRAYARGLTLRICRRYL